MHHSITIGIPGVVYLAALAVAFAIFFASIGAVIGSRARRRDVEQLDAHIETAPEGFVEDWRWPSHTPEVAR